MAKKYEDNSTKENRCKRCNYPIKDPTANYGPWCAKLLGLVNLKNESDQLDYNNLNMYNEDIYNQEGNGTDVANAFKHIFWSAYATKVLGEDYAKLFTHAHEFGWWEENKNDPEAMKMDLHNNQLGRKIGKETPFYVDLKDAVLRSVKNGNAAVLIDGKSMLYKP